MKEVKNAKALNARLPELYVENLEQRLETAPITSGGLLSVEHDSTDDEDCFIGCDCNCNNKCSCDADCNCYSDCGCNRDCGELCLPHMDI